MVNPQLANYIKTEEAQGYTEAQLRSTLLKQGYPQKDINEAINSNKSPSIPSPKKQSSARPTGITIIALLYMIFGGLGILYNIYGFFSSASLLGSIPVVGGILAGLSFFAIFINALTLAVGIGLWKLKKWARTATLIITIIGLVFSIILAILTLITVVGPLFFAIPIVVNIIILKYLRKDHVKKAFGI